MSGSAGEDLVLHEGAHDAVLLFAVVHGYAWLPARASASIFGTRLQDLQVRPATAVIAARIHGLDPATGWRRRSEAPLGRAAGMAGGQRTWRSRRGRLVRPHQYGREQRFGCIPGLCDGLHRGRNATRDRSRTGGRSAADLVDPIPPAGGDVGHRPGSGRGRSSVGGVSRRCRSGYSGGAGGFQWLGCFRNHSMARPAWTGHLGPAVGPRQCDRTGCRSPDCWYLHILFRTSDRGCARDTVRRGRRGSLQSHTGCRPGDCVRRHHRVREHPVGVGPPGRVGSTGGSRIAQP